MNCLKRNPVTAAKQIDDVLKQLRGKVVLSEIAFYCSKFEFWQLKIVTKRTEHMHASGLAVEAPEIDENEDSEVV